MGEERQLPTSWKSGSKSCCKGKQLLLDSECVPFDRMQMIIYTQILLAPEHSSMLDSKTTFFSRVRKLSCSACFRNIRVNEKYYHLLCSVYSPVDNLFMLHL